MLKNKFEKFINFCLKYGIRIIAIILAVIGILSIFITAYFNSTYYHPGEKTLFKFSFGITEILLSVATITLIAILTKTVLKKIPSKILLILLFIGSIIIYIIWVNVLKLTPENDQKLIHEMALGFLNGNINWFLGIEQYLFFYPYQFGLTLFVSFIYKLFGPDFMTVLILNCFCSIINMFILYYISKKLFDSEKIQKILVILLSIFSIYWMFFNVHFYGNIIGLTFALTAVLLVLLYLENNKFLNLLISGILTAISILLKTNYNIFLCGIILILILDIIKKWNLKTLLIIPIFLIGYFSINFGYEKILDYYDVELPDGVPMIAFVYMGMDEPTNLSPGWYNSVTLVLYRNNYYDTQKTTDATIKAIGNRLNYFWNNPKEFANYFGQKIGSTWLNPTFQTVWCSLPGLRYAWNAEYAEYISYHKKALDMVDGDLYDIEENIFNIYQIIVFLFASVGLIKLSKNIDLKKAFLPIIFIGGFVFHVIWETKAIYVIQYYFLLLPFAAFGLNYFIDKICSKLKKKKLLNEKN